MRIFVPNTTQINVLVSGGADSAILLYLLADQVKEIPIHAHCIATHLNTAQYAESVVATVNQLCGTQIPLRTWGKGASLWIRKAVELVQTFHPGVVYTGCTLNPWEDLGASSPVPIRGDPANRQHLRPFMGMTKDAILRLYVSSGRLDLLSVTRSCGVDTHGRCGTCFFCKERAWACDQIGIEDPDRT